MAKLKFVSKEPIEKGYSRDKKYCAVTAEGERFFLRVTPPEKRVRAAKIFRAQQRLAKIGVPVSDPVEYGRCKDGFYTVCRWIDGQDAREEIPLFTDTQQYIYGLEAGRTLKKIHSLPAPKRLPKWEKRYGKKADLKIKKYRECGVRFAGDEELISYIEKNGELLKNRPQSLQHGDFHAGNMMTENGKLVIVDFDRLDYGDPWEDFSSITWSAQSAPFFASGMVDGYFDCDVPPLFWKLLLFYIGVGTLGSFPWAVPFGDAEIRTMQKLAREVTDWYDGMKNNVPNWYKSLSIRRIAP